MATRNHPPLHGLSVFITTNTLDRRPLFAVPQFAEVASRVLLDTVSDLGVRLHAWVLMPDHMHLLLNLGDRDDLSYVMQLIKGRIARVVNGLRGHQGQVWQKRFDERIVRTEREFWDKVAYIHANPVRAGLADEVGQYRYSSAWDDAASPEVPNAPIPPR